MLVGICGLAGSGKDTAADFIVKHGDFVKVAFADPLKRICQDVYKFTDEQLWGPSSRRNEPDERYLRMKAGALGCTDIRTFCPDYGRVQPVPPGTFDAWPHLKGHEERVTWYGKEDNFGYLPSPPEDVYLTPRHALQQLGTEWGRHCYPNTWVDYAINVHDRLQKGDCYYDMKSGLRFMSSSEMMQSRKDVVISDVRFRNEVEAIKEAGGVVLRLLRGEGLLGAAGAHLSEQELLNIELESFDRIIDNREWSLKQFEDVIKRLSKKWMLDNAVKRTG